VNQATREALERRGYDYSKFNQVKREMADVRGFKMGDEGIEYVYDEIAMPTSLVPSIDAWSAPWPSSR